MEAKVEARPVIKVEAPAPAREAAEAQRPAEHEIKMTARDVNVYYGEKRRCSMWRWIFWIAR
jgi:hypothetical protein